MCPRTHRLSGRKDYKKVELSYLLWSVLLGSTEQVSLSMVINFFLNEIRW